MSGSDGESERVEHIHIIHHFVRDHVASGELQFLCSRSEDHVSDVLTKALLQDLFGWTGDGIFVTAASGEVLRVSMCPRGEPLRMALSAVCIWGGQALQRRVGSMQSTFPRPHRMLPTGLAQTVGMSLPGASNKRLVQPRNTTE